MTGTITETSIPLCCAMCLTVPEDPAALHNWGRFLPYWLCKDRKACMDRAVAAQRTARGTQAAEATEETSAPGAATETDPAVPPAGEGQPSAAPGAEHAQEAEPLEPLPAEGGDGTDAA